MAHSSESDDLRLAGASTEPTKGCGDRVGDFGIDSLILQVKGGDTYLGIWKGRSESRGL